MSTHGSQSRAEILGWLERYTTLGKGILSKDVESRGGQGHGEDGHSASQQSWVIGSALNRWVAIIRMTGDFLLFH